MIEAIDPTSGKKIYFDKISGDSTNTKPLTREKLAAEITNLYKIPQRLDLLIPKKNAKDYQERKRFLEMNNIAEWTVTMEIENGSPCFYNNVSGESCYNLPHELDKLGGLNNLENLKVNNNMLSELPRSLTKISTLIHLEVRNNRVPNLFSDFGKLSKLRVFKIDGNKIQHLPESMSECIGMIEINLASNMLHQIPPCILNMKCLQILNLGNNGIKMLPAEFGFLENLSDLFLYNNPLVDPSYDVVMKGTKETLWVCRQKYWNELYGRTPQMKINQFGVGNECFLIQPIFHSKIRNRINYAKRTNLSVELQQMNLTEIPEDVLKLQGLKRLDLSRNSFFLRPIEFSTSLCTLVFLALKSCKIREISISIQNLRGLKELNLENNHIKTFPKHITRLRKLERLILNNNSIQDVPDIRELSDLKVVNLDNNNLQYLPDGIR